MMATPPGWHWCWRRGRRGRPPVPRHISINIKDVVFIPFEGGVPVQNEPVYLTPDELEAFRLVYLEHLTQSEAAQRMGISRGTLWRCLESARSKIAKALVERRPIVITKTPPIQQ